ncbi:MAG TPA: condensation domain-containing protein, partial [Pseudonocardiaceae bacterium]
MTVSPEASSPEAERLRRQELLRARLAKARARRPGATAITRRPDGAPVQLSYAQRRLWFLSEYEPDSPAYNIPLAVRLRGGLDVEALGEALRHVVARHEVLRTLYPSVDGEPAPLLEPAAAFTVPPVERVADEDLPWWLAEQARRPFDLARELPIRVALAEAGPDHHMLSIVLHHIAADGWSIGVLADDLTAAYGALRAGGTPRLAELPVQYADVAHWQAERAAEGVVERDLAWWTEALRGAPTTLTVPTDRPRPAVAGDRGARVVVPLGAGRSARVRALATELDATPFVVLLAALQVVLSRYTGSEDVLVGSPIAGRTHSEMERLVGCFVNTLALRADLSGDPTVRELLHRVRDTTFGAFSHQDVPFERLVDALDLPRDLSHTPLFQVMLNVHNQPLPRFALAGLETEFTDTTTHTAKFDVSLAVVDDPAEPDMTVDLVWRTDLYDEPTVRRLFGHLTTVLDAMAADPGARVATLPLLTADERRMLAAVDGTAVPGVTSAGTLHGLVGRWVARTPDAVAVVGEDGALTYAELDARANAVARELIALGVGPDRPVGLLAERGAALAVGMLGILKAGGAYLPLDPVYPDGRIRDLLTGAGAVAVVATPELAGRVATVLPVVRLTGATAAPVDVAVPADALCYVLFTSGSTGRPKAVAVEHRNYLNYLAGLRDRTGAGVGWSWALVSTFAADLGTTNVFAALTGGGTLHLMSRDTATDVDAFAAYLREYPVDAVKLVPSHLEVLLRAGTADVLPRRLLICAGEPLRWELVERVRALRPDLVLHNHYGPTETTVSMLGTAVPAEPLPTPSVPLGRPFAGAGAHVLDARRRPVP